MTFASEELAVRTAELKGLWPLLKPCLQTDHQPFTRHELNSAVTFCSVGPPMGHPVSGNY